MRDNTLRWLSRMRAVEREHTAVRTAIDHLSQSLQGGAAALAATLKRLDLSRASGNLESTYIFRLFCEFEAALRQFLKSKNMKVPRNAKHKVDRTAARAKVSGDLLSAVHRVREFRNDFVHATDKERDLVTIRAATSIFCTYLDRLHW